MSLPQPEIPFGPNDYLAGIKVGGQPVFEGELAGSRTLPINLPQLFGGDKKEGGVVGTLQIRMGEADQLPLPGREAPAALVHLGVVAVGQGPDERVRADRAGGGLDLRPVGARPAEGRRLCPAPSCGTKAS